MIINRTIQRLTKMILQKKSIINSIHNSNLPHIPDLRYRVLMIGDSKPGKKCIT